MDIDYKDEQVARAWEQAQKDFLVEGLDPETMYDREVNFYEGWKRAFEAIQPDLDKLLQALRAAEEECAQWRWTGTQNGQGWVGQFYWSYGDQNDVAIPAANRNDDTRKRLGLDSIKPESGGYK